MIGEKEYRILEKAIIAYIDSPEFHEYLAGIIAAMQKNKELPSPLI